MRLLLLCLLIVATASSCTFLPSRNVRVDPRTEFPEARPYDGSQNLPGNAPAAEHDLRGAWYLRQTLADPSRDPIFSNLPRLFHALWVWLRDDGTYDLVYQAYWGARARNDPRLSAIDVRESGRFTIADGRLSLEPEATRAVEIRQGNRGRRFLRDEPRAHVVRVDGGYLHVAGPCASYQVEPICRESADVWITMRSVSTRSPDDVPEL